MESESKQKPCRAFPARDSESAATPLPRLLYSRRESAYQVSISVRALDYLIAEGRLKTRKIGGRILVEHEELLRFARHDRSEPMVPVAAA